jgi:hypothetical protein
VAASGRAGSHLSVPFCGSSPLRSGTYLVAYQAAKLGRPEFRRRRIRSAWLQTNWSTIRAARETAATTVVFSIANARTRPPMHHDRDHAGSGFNHDSAARVEAIVSPVRRSISSTTDVTYAGSVNVLNVPSTLDRAPAKPACKSAAAS